MLLIKDYQIPLSLYFPSCTLNSFWMHNLSFSTKLRENLLLLIFSRVIGPFSQGCSDRGRGRRTPVQDIVQRSLLSSSLTCGPWSGGARSWSWELMHAKCLFHPQAIACLFQRCIAGCCLKKKSKSGKYKTKDIYLYLSFMFKYSDFLFIFTK